MKEKKNQTQTNANNNNSNANMENDNNEEDENDKTLNLPINTNNISEETKQNIQNIIKNYETKLIQKKKYDTIFNWLTFIFIFVFFVGIYSKNYWDLSKYT